MTDSEQLQLEGYQAAREAAAFRRVPDAGYLRIAGADQHDYIQRQTTNDVRGLAPGTTQLSVLTSATARVLDVWRLVPEDDAIGVITLPGRGAATAQYLQRRIFFMDKVTVADASAEIAQFELIGPAAAGALAALGLDDAPAPDALASADVAGSAVRVIGQGGALGLGWRLLVDSGAAEALAGQLTEAGAVALDDDAYAVLRVEAGLPVGGHELTEAYTPLEAGLRAAVADAKGCYTGQEVIARQITYDKITKQLAGLRLASPVEAGAVVQAEGRRAGEVTSVAVSPVYGPIALAMIKRPHHAPGTAVTVTTEADEVAATVSALPFA